MTNIEATRIVPTSGIYNFRDYGGYAVAGGGHLRRGILLRSGQHMDATDADLDIVTSLRLSCIIDFRGASERSMHPCRRHPDFAGDLIIAEGETVDPAKVAAMTGSEQQPMPSTFAEGRSMMRGVYEDMPLEPVIVTLFRRYFDMLERSDSPTLVHCMAGKDRTGVAVFMLHHILGVHRDDIDQDYLASNIMPGRDAWMERTRDRLRLAGMLPEPAAFEGMMMVDIDLLKAATDTMVREFGSVDAYVEQVLGVHSARKEVLRARLIV